MVRHCDPVCCARATGRGSSAWVSYQEARPGPADPCLLPRSEPKFVKVFWIPENENPDDDKIYFFFRETAVEAAPALGRLSVSRVGQICRVRSPWATPGDPAPTPLPALISLSSPLIVPAERRGRPAQPGQQVDDVSEGAAGVLSAGRRGRHPLRSAP